MHQIEALVAGRDLLAVATGSFRHAVLCPLVQGFALLPITDAFAAEAASYRAATRGVRVPPLRDLPDGLHALALDISNRGPVAYVETHYFGGAGGQSALVWNKGDLTFSPATPGYGQTWPNSSISQALRMIGVVAEDGMDAFDTIGLGRHRETHRWAEAAG